MRSRTMPLVVPVLLGLLWFGCASTPAPEIDPSVVCEAGKPASDACTKAGDLEPEGVLFIRHQTAPSTRHWWPSPMS